jgi:hemerythrin superfamily protein
MNVIKLLKADHKEVDRMFKESEDAKGAKKRPIFWQIKAALEAHAYIEETIFYPTLQSDGDKVLITLTSEAIQEHIGMKCFLGELAAVSSDPSKFEPLLQKLIEDVRHHVKEEEGAIFPRVEKRFSAEALEALGDQMSAEKQRFQSSPETIRA